MKIKTFLVTLLLLALSSYSFAQSGQNEKVKEYQALIEEKNYAIATKMEEISNNYPFNYGELVSLINETIQEVGSMQIATELGRHRQLFIDYLNAHLTQIQVMADIENMNDMDYLNEVNQRLEAAYNKMRNEQKILCDNFNLVCED